MTLKNILQSIRTSQITNENIVSSLYQYSKGSLSVLMILVALITSLLYDPARSEVTPMLFLWATAILLLIMVRLYDATLYKNHKKRYSLKIWHKRFSVLTIITALLFSSISTVFFYDIDDALKLYIVILLIGTSGGSLLSLSADLRLNISYPIILVFPIIVFAVLIDTFPYRTHISIAAGAYFIFEIMAIYKIHKQNMTIESLESSNTMFSTLFKNAPISVFTYTENLELIYSNNSFSNLLETPTESLPNMNLRETSIFGDEKIFSNIFSKGGQTYNGPYLSPSKKNFWIEAKTFPFTDNKNVVLGGIGLIEDKTIEHTAQEKLHYLVEHDTLTGLYNRRGLIQSMNLMINKESHQSHFSILFYLDLNRFKAINDSLGHAIGDKILLLVAKRIVEQLDDKCMVSRLNSDEFIIMAAHIADNKESALLEGNLYVQNIQSLFEKPFIIQDMPIHLKSSIGILVIEPKEQDIEEMLRRVDISMYQAKSEDNYISYYDLSLDKKQKNLFVLQQNLAYATQSNQLKLYFQPIVQMINNEIIAAELLIRWAHPIRGMLSPEEFIPLAMKAGILSNITWWIIENACLQVQKWKSNGQWKLKYISINVSATQLIEEGFVSRFIKTLERADIEKKDILLEITERSLIDNFDNAQSVIIALKSYGVKCAIDDFGTGYSSLSYIKKLSFDTLKIDKVFVQNIVQKPKDLVLVKTILELGRQFDYNIIIEGIEDEAQKTLLLTLDKNLSYQGYFYSKAIDIDSFTRKFLS